MATLSGVNIYLDAVFIIGQDTTYTASIQVKDQTGSTFTPLDLNEYQIRFRVLGSPEADAKVLIEKIINQNTTYEAFGQIYDASGGEFSFGLTADETRQLGKGDFPMDISLMTTTDPAEFVQSITCGNQKYEFSKIRIVQV